MNEPCVPLPWDSEFFGVPIARATIDTLEESSAEAVDEWANSHGVACLYFVARADDEPTVRIAESRGFQLVDIRLTFERSLHSDAKHASGQRPMRVAVEADLAVLERMAREAHTDTRFYYDDHFPREAREGLYQTWIRNSVRGYADAVLVSGQGEPTGYVTCHIDRAGREGSIGLIAVKASERGKGLGKQLVNAAVDWFAARNLATVSVVTQGRNVVAQRLYQQCGFVTRSIQLYYHKWYSPGIEDWPPKQVQFEPQQ
jgi:dTDP-4-amino-4,6-dideoxy-D-galactose acyltransferase